MICTNRVVDVLAAVHLLLVLPLFIVVVGVDARWLRRSLHFHDQSLFGNAGKAAAAATPNDPMDYLDKNFQIPFALRSMNDVTARTKIRELLREPIDEPLLPGSPPQRMALNSRQQHGGRDARFDHRQPVADSDHPARLPDRAADLGQRKDYGVPGRFGPDARRSSWPGLTRRRVLAE